MKPKSARKLKSFLQTLTFGLAVGLTLPAWANHGKLAGTSRDAWINWDVTDLVASGLVKASGVPVEQMTNLQVAELTAKAARLYLAQVDPSMLPSSETSPSETTSPSDDLTPASAGPGLPEPLAAEDTNGGKSLADLVQEFRGELTAMGVEVDQLEDRLAAAKDRNEVFVNLQKEFLKRTGTDVGGSSRGYFYNYRGFGADSLYPPMSYNAAMYLEIDLKSVPVPSILFDARLRLWRSIGMYYQDPVQPPYQLRWISLTSYNDFGNLTAGDFFKSYTPLTLWNDDAPVYTLVEPTSFRRTRLDAAELVYMNQAPDWHLRGFNVESGKEWPKDPVLSGFKAQVMSGLMQEPGTTGGSSVFGSYYLGSQDSIGFFNHMLDFTGTGLILYDDPGSAAVSYLAAQPSTYPRSYQIGSVTSQVTVPIGGKSDIKASMENAFSVYNDDFNNPQRTFKDWALRADGSLNIEGLHLTAKYINNGPYFYSPGAQTNPYTPDSGSPGYLSANLGSEFSGLDDGLPGYLNQFVFQNVGRPFFAPYDRMNENFLPYGDASPDRKGLILGFSAELGNKGWLKPQASYIVSGQEIQPNLVLDAAGTAALPVDSETNTTTPRVFGGYEGALSLDFAKAFNLSQQTYALQVDYKHQTDDLGLGGAAPFTLNNLILAGDFTIPLHFINTLVWSVAFEQAQTSGSEYVIDGNTWASYSFYLNTANLGTYTYSPLNLTRQTLAFGVLFPLGDKIDFRGDLFLNDYKSSDDSAYSRQDQIWRLTYEAHF